MATNTRDQNRRRYRLRFPFWLDMTKPEEAALADQIELLKNDRAFSRTVRDGIRLIVDLRAGRLDVLFELFPWVQDAMKGSAGASSGDPDIRQEIADLKLIIMQGNLAAPPPDYPVMKPAGGIQPIAGAGRKMELPTLDDDEDMPTLVLKRSTSTDAAMNFLNSMSALQ